jgi:hypothetical protein
MKILRECPAAKWLPSRHHFALARLVAFVIARRTSPIPGGHVVLGIDGDQSAVENYAIAIWIFCTLVCFVAAALPLPIGVAILIAFPLAAMAIQLMIIVGGLLTRSAKVNSVAIFVLMIVASSYFAATASPIRYVAWFFFVVIGLNAAAWLIMAMFRQSVRELEQRCGI